MLGLRLDVALVHVGEEHLRHGHGGDHVVECGGEQHCLVRDGRFKELAEGGRCCPTSSCCCNIINFVGGEQPECLSGLRTLHDELDGGRGGVVRVLDERRGGDVGDEFGHCEELDEVG